MCPSAKVLHTSRAWAAKRAAGQFLLLVQGISILKRATDTGHEAGKHTG